MVRVRRLAPAACFAPAAGTRHRDEARCGIGLRAAKCPAGRLRLLRLGDMRSWLLLLLPLLLLLLTAELRLGSAEGDPLPPSLVDLVRNSPISSVEDLKLLLQEETNAIEDEEDEHDVHPNQNHGRYIRSLEAQPAQQAACKVRTEVMEVTRSMLDRRNANFLLWPPCVEVQRCSGCCNTRLLQCVPIVTSSRYLQVIKIQYINRKAHYEKAIISVEDHVSCRCQPSSSPSSSSSSSTVPIPHSSTQSNPNTLSPPQQQPPPSSHLPLPLPRPAHPAPPKTQTSKAELHRHDDLKYNQQHYHSEEREPVSKQWQQGSYTHLVHWTQPRVHQGPTHVQAGVRQTMTGLLGQVNGWPSEARAEHSVMGSAQQVGPGSGSDGSREESGVHASHSGGEVHHPDHAQRQQQLLQHQQRQQYQYQHHPHYPHQYNHRGAEDRELRMKNLLRAPQSDSATPAGSPTQLPTLAENSTSTIEKDSVTIQKNTQVTNHRQTETERISEIEGNAREENGSANSGDSAGPEQANLAKEKDSKVSSDEGRLTEEERRQKLLEMVQKDPDQPFLLHPQHPHQTPKPTTFKTALSTVAPLSASARQAPFRPASPRRRRRRRKRISKAAMRAMIMSS
ncbi:platelet-derived growth factor beta polypeptide a isoform X2 [Cololabis saira]|uniref:platelet-derived growth factor beta polypeptide a isoform X2 n=1 Tax=Cololabis saira TaxID=129043 RepID=UPI002AD55958|nr:platelet-derived growth factor beta polypeptide a isoform X2 [Cololabis saira]